MCDAQLEDGRCKSFTKSNAAGMSSGPDCRLMVNGRSMERVSGMPPVFLFGCVRSAHGLIFQFSQGCRPGYPISDNLGSIRPQVLRCAVLKSAPRSSDHAPLGSLWVLGPGFPNSRRMHGAVAARPERQMMLQLWASIRLRVDDLQKPDQVTIVSLAVLRRGCNCRS